MSFEKQLGKIADEEPMRLKILNQSMLFDAVTRDGRKSKANVTGLKGAFRRTGKGTRFIAKEIKAHKEEILVAMLMAGTVVVIGYSLALTGQYMHAHPHFCCNGTSGYFPSPSL